VSISESTNERQGILLESGTNEVEIMEFYLADQCYGINVAKVRQLVPYDDELFTKLPPSSAHAFAEGTYLYRGKTVPLISLNEALGRPAGDDLESKLVIMTEFNDLTNGFLVSGVNRIHRISWSQLQPMGTFFDDITVACTGTVSIEDHEILIVDFEQIVAEVNPASAMGKVDTSVDLLENEAKSKQNSEIKVVLADDSGFIRKSMLNSLSKAGFRDVKDFENGKALLTYLGEIRDKSVTEGKHIFEYVDIVISDIEMPETDGLTACRNIKENSILKDIPVILFSSLVNAVTSRKCESVGADGFLPKPRIKDLIKMVGELASKSGTGA